MATAPPVLEEELSEREAYVKSIEDYQVNFQSDLAVLLQRLQWTPQHFLEQGSALKVTCSYCPDHKMPVEWLKKHEDVCHWIQKGYSIEELRKEAPSSAFFYEKSKVLTIKLEKDAMNNAILDGHRQQMSRGSSGVNNPPSGDRYYTLISAKRPGDRDVPQTLAGLQVDFSQSERLALYEYVVQLAKESQRMQSMPEEDSLLTADLESLIKMSAKFKEGGEPCSSEAEKWAAMRDYKRRRQSYRAKNVHITKKTYTEIIREVINNQVDLLQEGIIINEENGQESKSNMSKHDYYSSSSKKLDAEQRKAKRNPDSSYKTQTGSSSRKRDWESPDRRKRETNKSDHPRARDQKSPDKRRRDRYNSPDPRKRDRKSPESRNRSRDSPDQRRSRASPDQRRSRSSPSYSRKRDRKSPDTRKRDKEDLDRRSRKADFEESWKHDRENLEGVSGNKSPDHKKRKLECGGSADDERKSLNEGPDDLEVPSSPKLNNKTSAEDNKVEEAERFARNMNESLAEVSLKKRLSSSEDVYDSDASFSQHRHRQKVKHKKSKKHKKHKHKSEKQDK